MPKEAIESVVARILNSSTLLLGENLPGPEVIETPTCILDRESKALIQGNPDKRTYSVQFTKAVRVLKPVLTNEQVKQTIDIVIKMRASGNHWNFRAKIGKPEWDWVSQLASSMKVKPVRVLEAVLFIYIRTIQPMK